MNRKTILAFLLGTASLIFGWVEISKEEYIKRKHESKCAGGNTVLH